MLCEPAHTGGLRTGDPQEPCCVSRLTREALRSHAVCAGSHGRPSGAMLCEPAHTGGLQEPCYACRLTGFKRGSRWFPPPNIQHFVFTQPNVDVRLKLRLVELHSQGDQNAAMVPNTGIFWHVVLPWNWGRCFGARCIGGIIHCCWRDPALYVNTDTKLDL